MGGEERGEFLVAALAVGQHEGRPEGGVGISQTD